MKKSIFIVLLLASARLFAQTATELNYGQQLSHDGSTQPGTWNYTWWGRAGRHYFVQTSTDLVTWTTLPNFNPRGTEAVLGVSCTDTDLPTIFMRLIVFDPSQAADALEDTDGNGLPDVWELYYFGHSGVDPNDDPDSDGLTNLQEFQYGGNPLVASTDQTGMSDGWEVSYFGHLFVDPNGDPDGDGFTNLREFQNGTNPTDFYNSSSPRISSMVNTSALSVFLTSAAGATASITPYTPTSGGIPGVISVVLTNANGALLVNAPVEFLLQGTGGLSATQSGASSSVASVMTDGNGIATVYVSAGAQGAVLVAPAGAASANITDQSHGIIDLGSGLVPLGVATDGTITLRGLNSDGTTKVLRWRNGVTTQLTVPSSIYAYAGYSADSLSDFYPELSSYGLGITPSGLVFSFAGSSSGSGSMEGFATIWPAGLQTPLVLRGPLLQIPSTDPNTGQTHTSEFSSVSILRITNDDQVWLGDQQSIDPARSSVGQLSLVYDAPIITALGVGTQLTVGILDVNSAHQPISFERTPEGVYSYYVGSSPKQALDFVPLAINDAGIVLGDTLPADGSLLSNADLLRNIDAWAPNIIQQADGMLVTKPLIRANSQKIYLQGVTTDTVVRVVGLDSAGNVYGSFNRIYDDLDGSLVSPGQNVIWVAQPSQWGLPANTPAYTPISWTQPLLGSSWQSSSTTSVPTGIAPFSSGIQLGVAAKVDDSADHSSAHAYAVISMGIAVDANRDGSIKFANQESSDATSSSRPYRFWVNDDIDRGHTVDGNDYEQDDISPTEAAANNWVEDWKSNTVQSKRDLEDFARIVVSTSGLSDAFGNGDLCLGLKWTDTVGTPSIKLYKQYDATGGTSYLTDDYQASVQLTENAILNQRYPSDDVASPSAHTAVTPGDLFVLPQALWFALSGDTLKRSLLFEGCTAGTGQLKLVILKRDGTNYTEIGDGPGVWLDLKNIRDMYEHWTVGQGPVPYGGGAPGALSQASSFTYTAQSPEESKYILYVHGWNMEQWEKERFAETAYKRLYWQGYKGRFGLFSWPTTNGFTSSAAIADSNNYDRGEFSAWRSASLLEEKLTQLNSPGQYPGQVYLLAHSMGNVVAGEALRRAGQDGLGVIVRAYVASQAALPVHCYNGSSSDNLDPDLSAIPASGVVRVLDGGWPETANAYKSWLTANSAAVAKRVNFFNINDWALWRDVWQLNQWFKPDHPDFRPNPPDPQRTYRYLDEINQPPTQDGFGWLRPSGQVDPSDRPYLNNTWYAILRLGNAADVKDRYEIMAMACEARSKALGATSINEGLDGSVWLGSVWPADTENPIRPYSAHKWHSAEFRSTNMLQKGYWEALLGPQGFNIVTPP